MRRCRWSASAAPPAASRHCRRSSATCRPTPAWPSSSSSTSPRRTTARSPTLLQRSTAMPVRQVRADVRLEADRVYVIAPGHALRRRTASCTWPSRWPTAAGASRSTCSSARWPTRTAPHATAVVLSGAGRRRRDRRQAHQGARRPDRGAGPGRRRARRHAARGDRDRHDRLGAAGRRDAAAAGRVPAHRTRAEAAARRRAAAGRSPARRRATATRRRCATCWPSCARRTGRDFSPLQAGDHRAAPHRAAHAGQRRRRRCRRTWRALRTQPGEVGALLQDLLISVTNFFRDAALLRGARGARCRTLFKGKGPGDRVRAWVAGCATGEEAYSIAMLLAEQADRLEAPPLIQVFATDLDEQAIRTAAERPLSVDDRGRRVGRATAPLLRQGAAGLPRPPRAARDGAVLACTTCCAIRRSRALDLVSLPQPADLPDARGAGRACSRPSTSRCGPAGCLFLGTSETVEEGDPLFAVLDKKNRIYVRRGRDTTGTAGAQRAEHAGDVGRFAPERCAAAGRRRPDARAAGRLADFETLRSRRGLVDRAAPQAAGAGRAAVADRRRPARDRAPVRARRKVPAVRRRRAERRPAGPRQPGAAHRAARRAVPGGAARHDRRSARRALLDRRPAPTR